MQIAGLFAVRRRRAGTADERVVFTLPLVLIREACRHCASPSQTGSCRYITGLICAAMVGGIAGGVAAGEHGRGAVTLSVAVVDPACAVARQALRAHMDDIASRWYGRPASTEEVDAGLVLYASQDLRLPDGLLLVARNGPAVLGCAGLRLVGGGVGEITRVHVARTARRQGLGRRLMLRLEHLAREHRVQTLRLDTRSDLVEARAMYATLGYSESQPSMKERTRNIGSPRDDPRPRRQPRLHHPRPDHRSRTRPRTQPRGPQAHRPGPAPRSQRRAHRRAGAVRGRRTPPTPLSPKHGRSLPTLPARRRNGRRPRLSGSGCYPSRSRSSTPGPSSSSRPSGQNATGFITGNSDFGQALATSSSSSTRHSSGPAVAGRP